MNKDVTYTFRIESGLLASLKAIQQRDGIPVSEQIRRAIRGWLEEKGELVGAEKRTGRKRAGTR